MGSEDIMGDKAHTARRWFLARLGTGLTFAGGTFVAGAAAAEAQSAPDGKWTPDRHTQDAWLDQLSGKHRFVFDTTSSQGLANAMLYVNNYYNANQSGYGLRDSDLAVVIVVRHDSTAYAYNDAMWAKYGSALASVLKLSEKQPSSNPYFAGQGNALAPLTRRGVHLAVCQMATRRFAGGLADASGGNPDAVYSELVGNLIPNCHMVPAGIVAVNRAQEHGYSFANSG